MKLTHKTPKGAANAIAYYLRQQAEKIGYNPDRIVVMDPERSQECGYGQCWTVCWEEGPFEWTMISSGCKLLGPEFGKYSEVGDWPDGIQNEYVFSEPYNNHVLCFYSS